MERGWRLRVLYSVPWNESRQHQFWGLHGWHVRVVASGYMQNVFHLITPFPWKIWSFIAHPVFYSHSFCSCSFEVLLSILSVTLIDLFLHLKLSILYLTPPVFALFIFSLPSIFSMHATLRVGEGEFGLGVIMMLTVTIQVCEGPLSKYGGKPMWEMNIVWFNSEQRMYL